MLERRGQLNGYSVPPDQVLFEANLVDDFRHKFPAQLYLLNRALEVVRRISNHRQTGQVLARLALAKINYPASDGALKDDVVYGVVPDYTERLVDGLYGLTGAQVVYVDDPHSSATTWQTFRTGVYPDQTGTAEPVFFSEVINMPKDDLPSMSLSVIRPDVALELIEEARSLGIDYE